MTWVSTTGRLWPVENVKMFIAMSYGSSSGMSVWRSAPSSPR